MNDNLENRTMTDGAFDDHWFDLLADGELPDEARRDLLARLDRESDGWRRCALAFLEAQTWRGTARSMVRESVAPVTDKQAVSNEQTEIGKQVVANVADDSLPSATQQKSVAFWRKLSPGTMWAMAASFLIAFLLGIGWRGGRNGDELVVRPDNDKQAAHEAGKSSEPFVNTASTSSLPEDLKLLVRGGTQGTPQKVELPVFEAGDLDPFWLENRPAPMPENVVRQLEQLGHQVKQQRRMIRVNLDDGRQMVVPVDQVEVVPVKWQ